MLEMLQGFDAGISGPTEIDWKLASNFVTGAPAQKGGGFFALTTNALSTHCGVRSTMRQRNQGASLLEVDEVCLENGPI